MNNTPLSLTFGEKIKQVRVKKGHNQDGLAKALGVSMMYISRLERGLAECDDKTISGIRHFLDIENAPLLEHELADYRNRLWVWNDIIAADRLNDAKAMQSELSPILKLPYERDLILLYWMIETRLLFKEGNLAAAEERLNSAKALLDATMAEAHHLYHRNMGFLFFCSQAHRASLRHFLRSLEYVSDNIKPDAGVYLNIGTAYVCLGKPWQSILNLEQAKAKFNIDRTSNIEMGINSTLAICYSFVGEFDKAEKLFNISLMQAKRINDENAIGIVLSNLGQLYAKSGRYEASVKIYDEALEHLKIREIRDKSQELFQSDKYQRMQVLAGKSFALIRLKDYAQCKGLATQLNALAEGNEIFSAIAETITCLITLDDSKSTDYIEKVAIPYFRYHKNINNGIYLALEVCEILEAHYNKKRSTKKAHAVATTIRDIQKAVYYGAVVLD